MIDRRLFLLGALSVGACARDPRAQGGAEGPPPMADVIVGHGGGDGPRAASLREAVAMAPASGARPFRIALPPGIWREKVVIDRPFIHLVGAGAERTMIVHDTPAGAPGPDGTPWGTWGAATLIVRAPDFAARDLTIANDFDYLGHLAKPRFETIGPNGAQAPALMLDRGSDRVRLDQVSLVSHQDTLFCEAGRALFNDCRIAGSVDFIFGAGTAFFADCVITSRHRPGLQRNHGYVAAPSTPIDAPYGLVFSHCRLEREAPVPAGSVVLGRPWRPRRAFPDGAYGDPRAVGQALYLNCWMDEHISADGWDSMTYPDRAGQRLTLTPAEARFGEFGSTGPGAFENRRRPWISADSAARATRDTVLAPWWDATPAARVRS